MAHASQVSPLPEDRCSLFKPSGLPHSLNMRFSAILVVLSAAFVTTFAALLETRQSGYASSFFLPNRSSEWGDSLILLLKVVPSPVWRLQTAVHALPMIPPACVTIKSLSKRPLSVSRTVVPAPTSISPLLPLSRCAALW